MKQLILLAAIVGLTLPLMAQETPEKIMEKRARELHRVIGLNDKEQWKAFMKANYTQALIDKPMRAVVESSEGNSSSTTSSSQSKATDNLEAKTAMFQRLHDDFGKSKITSIKTEGEKTEMVLKNEGGLSGTFMLTFSKNMHYLIDGLGIEVQDIER